MITPPLWNRSRRYRIIAATATTVAALVTLIVMLVVGAHVNHSAPAHSPSRPPAAQVNVFGLLPFNQQQLNTAYTSAARSTAAYETFTYTDTPASYGARISPWVTSDYRTFLQRTFGNTTATTARTQAHERSTATSAVRAIRVFGPTSITFITHIQQNDPVTDDSGDYAVTVETTNGQRWLTSNIVPTGAGNT